MGEPPIGRAAADIEARGVSVRANEAGPSTIECVDWWQETAGGRQTGLLCPMPTAGSTAIFLEQDAGEWRSVVYINLRGTIYLIQRMSEDMVARNDGRAQAMGSIVGFIPDPLASLSSIALSPRF